jgi:hypothetical protein
MPDFERVIDALNVELARAPEKKAYLVGYAKGKSRARIEVAVIVTIIHIVVLAIKYCVG